MLILDIKESVLIALRTFIFSLFELLLRGIIFAFNIFYELAESSFFNNETIQLLFNRVGLILGLFMVFRLTFSVIDYIINPDNMLDKQKGLGNIVKKVFIVVVLLGTTHYIFQFARTLEYRILESNIIGRVIFPDSSTDKESAGANLAYTVFSTFYRYNEDDNAGSDKDIGCKEIIGTDANNSLIADELKSDNTLKLAYNCLEQTYDTHKDGKLVSTFVVTFDWFFAIVAAGVILYMVFMYTIQVGVRTIQLAYLELIAPIPIMMYLNPKGDDNLKKWANQCTTTYVDIFIRIAIIYFVILVIGMINDNTSGIGEMVSSSDGGLYIRVILIIALLTFAKKVPDLLSEILPSMGSKAKLGYGLDFKKNVVEPLKYGYNTPLGWGLKLGKSVGTGIDRKVHGKDFFGDTAFRKAIDKWLPEQAAVRKKKIEAMEDIDSREGKLKAGKELFNKYDETGIENAFQNAAYRDSYLAVGAAKDTVKNTSNQLDKARAILNAAYNNGDSEQIKKASAIYEKAVKNDKDAQGALELAKARHESNKKIYTKDAEIEDAYKFYKDTSSKVTLLNEDDLNNRQNDSSSNNGVPNAENSQSNSNQNSQ